MTAAIVDALRAIVSRSVGNPRSVLAAWTALVLLSIPGVAQVEVDATVDSVLDRSSDDWRFYQESKALFGDDEVIVVVLDLASVSLGDVRELGNRLSALAGVERVDSVFSYPALRTGSSGELRLDPLSEAEFAEGGLRWLQDVDRLAPGFLISHDGRFAAVNIRLEVQNDGGLDELILGVRRACSGLCLGVSGVPVFRDETNRRIQVQLLELAPIAALLLFSVLAFILGSVVGAVCSVLAGLVAAAVTLGLMGYVGVELTISTLVLPTILVGLGTAYSIHFIVARASADGSIAEALLPIAAPVALSGATTAIGLAAIATVPIEAVRQLAGLGVVGTALATACALTLAPAACVLRGRTWGNAPLLGRVSDCVIWIGSIGPERPALAAAFSLALLVPAGAGLHRIEVNTDVIRWYPDRDWVRSEYEVVRRSLAGITAINAVVEPQTPDALIEPEAIGALDAFTQFLRREETVGWVGSIADPILQLHGELGGMPTSLTSEGIEQYLTLLESEPRFRDLLSSDRQVANVPILLSQNDSQNVMQIAEKIRRWWAARPDLGVRVTGVMYEFARAEERIAWGQLLGLGFAVFAIGCVLAVATGSVRLGLVALFPNIGPVLIGVGLMGWMGAAIDAGSVVIGTLALGLAVDDTIHLVIGNQRCESHVRGRRRAEVVVGGPGPALALTTAALCVAFGALAFSSFAFVRNLGIFTSVILILSLVADVLLIPWLLQSASRDASDQPIPRG